MSEHFYWSALAFERFQPLALCVPLYKKKSYICLFFPRGFGGFFFNLFYLALYNLLHSLLACTCTLALCCFNVKTGNSWQNRFTRTGKHAFAQNISTDIWHLLYMEKLLKTILRKESEELLSLASRTDVRMYIYRKWDSRQTRWFACNALLNLACSKSKNVT